MQKLFLWVACLGLSTAYAAEPNAIEPNTKDSAYVDVKEPLVTVNSKSYEKTNTADDVDTVQINV